MDKAPESDRVVMGDAGWQASMSVSIKEALRQGIDGWFDEGLALSGDWRDVELAAVGTSLTWWHAGSDANAPLSAAQRLLEQIPHAQLRSSVTTKGISPASTARARSLTNSSLEADL